MLLDGFFGVERLKVGSLEDNVENFLLVEPLDSGLQNSFRGASEDLAYSDLVESGLQDFGNGCIDDGPNMLRTVLCQTKLLLNLHLRLACCGSLPFS